MDKKDLNLKLLDIVITQAKPEYKEMLESFKMFYEQHGYIGSKQREVIANTVKFTCFGT